MTDTHEDRDVERVAVTPEAAEMLRGLWAKHGPLMFHQSGGCCDGSAPMCFADGDFITSDADVHLGDLVIDEAGSQPGAETGTGSDGPRTVPVWMSLEQYEVWKHTHLTIDVVPGRGAGFSLEAPSGKRFLIRSRLLNGRKAVVGETCEVPTAAEQVAVVDRPSIVPLR